MAKASFQVTFDATNPQKLAEFWGYVLGYKRQDPPPGYATWDDYAKANNIPPEMASGFDSVVDPEGKMPRLLFVRVPEGKTAKNRMHLDLHITERGMPEKQRREIINARAAELVERGATKLREVAEINEFWVVMQDPEGNEFCLA
jgi:hypothetical protein